MIISTVEKADYLALKDIVSICILLMNEVPESEKNNLKALILENIEHALEAEGHSYLKAVDKGFIVGFVLIKGHEKLSELFVLPEYRKSGVGAALLKNAINESASKNAIGYVWVNAALNAIPFYIKHGFTDYEVNDETFGFVKKLRYNL